MQGKPPDVENGHPYDAVLMMIDPIAWLMGKVSIGLRGWRFDEGDIFTEDGELRSLDEMPLDVRNRVVRLSKLVDKPCDACWLIYGDDDVAACNVAEVVYGEPMAEVLVCGEHEVDLLYWYRIIDGHRFRGEERFQDAFHEWFAAGNRAPAGYAGIEHVETAPASLPRFDEVGEMEPVVTPEDFGIERKQIDLRRGDQDG